MAQVIVGKVNKAGKIDTVYDSISTAASHAGVDASNLRKVIVGIRNECGGQTYRAIGTKQAQALTKKFGRTFGIMSAKRAQL